MKVGCVTTIGGPDGADLLASLDELTYLNIYLVQVGIHGLQIAVLGMIGQEVGDSYDLTPATTDIFREGHQAVGRSIDGVSQVCVSSFFAVPVLPEVFLLLEFEGSVVIGGIWLAYGKIESIGQKRKIHHEEAVKFPLGYAREQMIQIGIGDAVLEWAIVGRMGIFPKASGLPRADQQCGEKKEQDANECLLSHFFE